MYIQYSLDKNRLYGSIMDYDRLIKRNPFLCGEHDYIDGIYFTTTIFFHRIVCSGIAYILYSYSHEINHSTATTTTHFILKSVFVESKPTFYLYIITNKKNLYVVYNRILAKFPNLYQNGWKIIQTAKNKKKKTCFCLPAWMAWIIFSTILIF